MRGTGDLSRAASVRILILLIRAHQHDLIVSQRQHLQAFPHRGLGPINEHPDCNNQILAFIPVQPFSPNHSAAAAFGALLLFFVLGFFFKRVIFVLYNLDPHFEVRVVPFKWPLSPP